MNIRCILVGLLLSSILGCGTSDPAREGVVGKHFVSYASDVSFLKGFLALDEITSPDGNSQVALSSELQGRVMTTAYRDSRSISHGWINRAHFESGDTSLVFNPYGGEERLWFGPESGPFSLFAGEDGGWQVPRFLDTEPFETLVVERHRAVYGRTTSITNASGFTFYLRITREIEALDHRAVIDLLDLDSDLELMITAYRSVNEVRNLGSDPWTKDSGLFSIWMLGMYPPTDQAVVILPYVEGDSGLGAVVTTEYLNGVPPNRLKVEDGVALYRADGDYRSKIGLSPRRSKSLIGAYDASRGVLTVVVFNLPLEHGGYVNSIGSDDADPYDGDVVNAYNDGPASPGAKPLGPFYELETSSPALALGAGESYAHIQTTVHLQGKEVHLDAVMSSLFGVQLEQLHQAFKN